MQVSNLLLIMALGLAILIVVLAAWLILRRLALIERRFGPVVPLWKHVQIALSGELMHPHDFAKELDDLMRAQNNATPDAPLSPAKLARLTELVKERAAASNPELREYENEFALMYLKVMPLEQREGNSPVQLTGIMMVGSQAPDNQSASDEQSTRE